MVGTTLALDDLSALETSTIIEPPVDLNLEKDLLQKCALGRHYCVVCEQQFSMRHDFEAHARTHRKVTCLLCKKVCITGLRLVSHIRNAHTPRAKPYQCPSCEKFFSTANSLWVHRKTVHKKSETYNCDRCGYGAENESLFQEHLLKAGDTHSIFSCDACDKVFTSHQNLDKHTQLFHTAQLCRMCNKEYSNRSNFLRHMQRSHGKEKKKDVPCPQCPKMFFSRWQLKIHMNVHNNVRLQCKICEYNTVFPQALKTHEKIHAKEYNSICDWCGKGFMNKGSLRSHLAKEHLGTSLDCSICGKKFYAKKYLNLHMECHQPDYALRNHACHLCSRRFLRRPMLRRHLRAHEGLRKYYKCSYCDKTLSSSASLRDHTNIHTGLRPYACELCGNAFARKNYLVAHIRTHTKEKPYGCDVCSASFSQRGALTMHLKKHFNPVVP